MLVFFALWYSINFIKKHLINKDVLPQWYFYFDKIIYGVATALFIFDVTNKNKHELISNLLLFLFFAFIFYILWLLRDNRTSRLLLWAIVPIIVLHFIGNIVEHLAPKIYEEYDTFFEIAIVVSLIWMFGFGISASKQQKALNAERAKAEAIEKQNQLLEALVAERTTEILEQKESLEKALEELKETQNQLVQREKLASLGELTAGIAHEIQNPLNFVNNFSELSVELLKELSDEIKAPSGQGSLSALGAELMADLIQNQEKINHHGKRASSIVKNMLEHSRISTGERESIDINALADEYLRLSYHGMRAKNKSFNADFELITNPDLPNINVVPQDIGRVLLNIINNAFQAVQGVKNSKIIVSTSSNEGLVIKVSDNGSGMSEATKAKIFQPFFTTKPTGEGTGLGLSLSYDIITKGHGGTIEVESEENVGTTFTIKLPI